MPITLLAHPTWSGRVYGGAMALQSLFGVHGPAAPPAGKRLPERVQHNVWWVHQ